MPLSLPPLRCRTGDERYNKRPLRKIQQSRYVLITVERRTNGSHIIRFVTARPGTDVKRKRLYLGLRTTLSCLPGCSRRSSSIVSLFEHREEVVLLRGNTPHSLRKAQALVVLLNKLKDSSHTLIIRPPEVSRIIVIVIVIVDTVMRLPIHSMQRHLEKYISSRARGASFLS
jgi:hypothetical protein